MATINTRTYPENFVRTPIKGLRLRFRTLLRKLGVEGKFGTDALRHGTLRVKGHVSMKPITSFEGRPVIYVEFQKVIKTDPNT